MTKIKKHWRLISLGYFVISYLIIVVAMKQPLSTYLIGVLIYLSLFILVFFGTFLGLIGIILQVFIKKESAAVPFYRAGFKYGTNNPTILASYGLILLRINESKDALACFERGLIYSNHFLTTRTLLSNKAISYWKLGDLDTALEIYHEIIRKFGDDDQAFLTEPDYSDDHIEQFITDNHVMYPQDFTTIGYLYILKKDFEKATFFTHAAMHQNKDYASAYDNLGQIAYYQDDLILAKEHFIKALELDPNLPDSLYYMALILKHEDKNSDAKSLLLKAKSCKLDGLNTISHEMIDDALRTLV